VIDAALGWRYVALANNNEWVFVALDSSVRPIWHSQTETGIPMTYEDDLESVAVLFASSEDDLYTMLGRELAGKSVFPVSPSELCHRAELVLR
jgi:hypothetical protein